MLFNSISFFFFFSIVTVLYFLLPYKFRWVLLLASSCYFYMAFVPVYILILGFTIVIDYFAGILIEQAEGKTRKLFLLCSLAANIGILAIFKYYNFINDGISALFQRTGHVNPLPYLSILLPIGLSFHTFQAMSYTIEVFRGKQRAERHFGIYALYVMFYPQLVAGPIERPQNLLHQFDEEHYIDYIRITDGLKLMAWGLFKKIVIADRLGSLVDNVYNDPYHHHGLSFVIATVFFAIQIFCDFSGYSDMAIGIAKVMGFKLMRNFNSPYHAKTIKEFWGRWHISLSSWFKDYVYIPLGGNRVPVSRWCLNIMIVFLISGLWHGASLTFVVWGALHGFYFIIGELTLDIRTRLSKLIGLNKFPKLNTVLQTLVTFALVCLAWVFFRAKSIGVALYIIKSMLLNTTTDILNLVRHQPSTLNLGLIGSELVLAVASIVFLEIVHLLQSRINLIQVLRKQPFLLRWSVYYIFLFVLVLYSAASRQFIYFQF
ncbi:MAG: alginate O-acetyltransferase complex protein AlgI [Mucilaginibacter sp.]|nr:alginate O-acetyltransferase complex protein AlgI [Mucilaginibacter sp.]